MSSKKENVDEFDEVLEALMEDETFRAEYRQHLMYAYSLIYGRQGFGKNYAAASKMRENVARMRRGGNIQDQLVDHSLPKLPQKGCTYRKPKVYWFGELHGSNNLAYNPTMEMSSRGWDIPIKNYHGIPGTQLSMWPAMAMGTTTGRNPLERKRFIGISEPDEGDQMDNDFIKRLTGDEWVETRTYKKSEPWKPLGKIFVMSGQPPVMHNKDKETIERVKEITYTETTT